FYGSLLSAEALTILPETSTEPPVTALITTALSTVVIRPNSDPFLLVEDYKNPYLAGAVPEDVILGPEGQGKVGGSTEGDGDVGDLVFSQLDNEARDAVFSPATRNRGTGDGLFPGDICRWRICTKRQKWVLRGTNSCRLFSQRIRTFSPATCCRG
ncbi:hypothetical protein Tco_0208982, partial [Tanacetum coccineum]